MRNFLRSVAAIVLGFVLLSSAALYAADIDTLNRNFDQPPDDCRIMMRWWWFGPCATKPELERELKMMKESGIGGVEVQPIYPLSPDDNAVGIKNYKILSQEYFDALTFTAEKAKELGLRMDLTLGSGWPYGGPQFQICEAAGRLRVVKVEIDSDAKEVPVPKLNEGERLVTAFAGPLNNSVPEQNQFAELKITDNTARIPSEIGKQTEIGFVIAGQTKMKVKRAAYGGEGYVIDHYNPVVIEKFLKEIAEPALKACGPNPPYAVFCDSMEVGGEDWTFNFLDEFQKRRGYDLRPHLPALFNNSYPKAMDIRYDWGKTLTDLFNDYFITAIEKWSKANGSRFRLQAYGTPPSALSSYAYADLGEGEGYTWKGFRESRWASSANHLLGRPITSSETWTWLHSPVFRATPLDIKAEANLHFLQGVNQLIGHGWPYSAPGVEYPGWRLYASMAFGESNPWWIVMPDPARYLQRVSYMMRQGQPANDVALYVPESDAWAGFAPGRVSMNSAVSRRLGKNIIRRILESGYNFDFFDDGLLDMRGKVENGKLVFGDVQFNVVVLADVERIPPSTMQKLDQFVKGGGILIATRGIPSIAPGFKASDDDQKTVKEIANRLFKDTNAPGIFLESESDLGQALSSRLPPDVKFEPAAEDIGFVHRKTGSEDIYFLANTGNTVTNVKATFRVKGMSPESWDPMIGRVKAIEIAEQNEGGISINLNIEPYASRIIVFTKRKIPSDQPKIKNVAEIEPLDISDGWSVYFGKESKPVMMDHLNSWTQNEATRYFSGVAVYEKTVSVPAEMLKEGRIVRLSLGESKPKAQTNGEDSKPPEDASKTEPASDTAEALKAPTRPGPRMQAFLDVPVCEAAVVYINGKRAGSVWCPPYNLDITGLLKDGENNIRIEVANLAVNYMSDFKNHPLPDYKELKKQFGDRFQPQDMNKIQPVTSGLLGPIQIIAKEK